jgi:MFS family permease
MSDLPPAQTRRNFVLWVVETAAWVLATAFIDSTTVLPVLVQSLSGSAFLASLIISFRYGGQTLPQLIAASVVSGKPYRKPYYAYFTVPGRLLLLWPAALLLAGVRRPALTVTAILVAYLAFWVSEGLSIVPWTDMLGKTVAPTRRGRLFALMHIIGGLLGIVAGLYIRTLLTSPGTGFPRGYGVLFLLATGGLLLSTGALGLLREPPGPPHEERYSTRALIRDIPNLLRGNPQYRLLVLLQALFSFSILPAPLYILYASGLLQHALPGRHGEESLGVGVFLAVQTAGMIVGNAILGGIADRYGNRLLLRTLALVHAVVPVWAAVAGGLAGPSTPGTAIYLLFAPTFFLYGALLGSTWMGVTNYLLEIAPPHDRPAYIAVTNALNIPAIVLPMLGGLVLRVVGYHPIFLIAGAVLLSAYLLSGKLLEPRVAAVAVSQEEAG